MNTKDKSSMSASPPLKCAIVGAGPVGALAALNAARRGWQVDVYELRGDPRDDATTPLNFTKSINLALSHRGITAIRAAGYDALADQILSQTVPMYGRMIHTRDSKGDLEEHSQLYDFKGRYNNAVDRGHLNNQLLDELETLENVKLHFNHKLTGADFKARKAWFEQKHPLTPKPNDTIRPKEIEIDYDLILGCDGAHSSVRFHLMKFVRMNYEQSYIDTLWCEFQIPPVTPSTTTKTPSARDTYATSPNHLHIWPSGHEMFIAIPNLDGSFTCTLFAPSSIFTHLETHPNDLTSFFNTSFPGAADLIGPSTLHRQFTTNPHLPLISIKCSPHIYGSSGAILGDAAHAMVPFYGQGMNAGMEDVRVLFSHLDSFPSSEQGRAAALQAYTEQRVPDAHTINDLALANYWEMHAGVQSPLYLLRKNVEEFLAEKVPSTGFATLYSRVSFSDERYSEVVKAVRRQGMILLAGAVAAVLVPVLSGLAWWVWVARYRGARMVRSSGVVERLKSVFERAFGR